MKARAGWSEKQRLEHGLASPFAVISSVPRADDLTADQLARIARQGLGDGGDEAGNEQRELRRRSNLIDSPADDISSEQWQARHAP